MSRDIALCESIEWSRLKDISTWILEPKYDGERAIAEKKGEDIKIESRWGRNITFSFPEIMNELLTYPYNFTIDGEIVAGKKIGGNFEELQTRIPLTDKLKIDLLSKGDPCRYIVFDVKSFQNQDIRKKPLRGRREFLRYFDGTLVNPVANYSLQELYELEEREEIEGVVVKDPDSPYTPGRSRYWLKSKRVPSEDLLIVGYVPYGIDSISSLIMEKNNEKIYVSRGLSSKERRFFRMALDKFAQKVDDKFTLTAPIYAEVKFHKHGRYSNVPIFHRLKIDR